MGSIPTVCSMKEYLELMGFIERHCDPKVMAEIQRTLDLLEFMERVNESRSQILEISPIDVLG